MFWKNNNWSNGIQVASIGKAHSLLSPVCVGQGTGRQVNPLFSCKVQNSKKKFQHLHGKLNLDEIKNALHSLPVNRKTNLMNLIMTKLDAKLLQ